MGPLCGRGRHIDLCAIFRRGTRLHSLDDHGGAFQSRTTSGSHVYCGTCQLVGQFPCRPILLASQGINIQVHVSQLMNRNHQSTTTTISIIVLILFFFLCMFCVKQAALQNYIFLPFSVLLAFFWVFTYKIVPETKNKTFDEISALFRRGDR